LEHLLAVHVGQAEVQHHQVGAHQRRLAEALGTGARFDHLVALGGQADAQELANLRFVVDDQQGTGQKGAGNAHAQVSGSAPG
jgi:hypothetical protein